MCILQDFEAVTPNLLARTVETVEGGGLVVLLLKTMTSLKQLYTVAMVSLHRRSVIMHVAYSYGIRMSTRGTEQRPTVTLLRGSMSGLSYRLRIARTAWSLMTS